MQWRRRCFADRYHRLAADFAATIDAVPADRWASPSPCEEWTARDVVAHVVETHGMFEGMVGRDLGEIPAVADDPAGAFAAARAVVHGHLCDPEAAGATYESPMLGTTSFAEMIDRPLEAVACGAAAFVAGVEITDHIQHDYANSQIKLRDYIEEYGVTAHAAAHMIPGFNDSQDIQDEDVLEIIDATIARLEEDAMWADFLKACEKAVAKGPMPKVGMLAEDFFRNENEVGQ